MSSNPKIQKVYITRNCLSIAPIERELRMMNLTYQRIDVDDDLDERNNLSVIANGFLSVPTLVFDDGTILIEPSVEELRQKLGIQDDAEASERDETAEAVSVSEQDDLPYELEVVTPEWAEHLNRQFRSWLWGGVLPVFGIGLLFFGLGARFASQIGFGAVNPRTLLYSVTGFAALFIILFLIRRIRPISALIDKVKGRNIMRILQWVFVPLYALLAGVALNISLEQGKIGDNSILLTYTLILALSVPLLILIALATRFIWLSWYGKIMKLRGGVNILAVFGFMGIFIYTLVAKTTLPSWIFLLILIPMGLSLLFSCLQLGMGIKAGRVIDQSSSLVYTCIGVLVAVVMMQ